MFAYSWSIRREQPRFVSPVVPLSCVCMQGGSESICWARVSQRIIADFHASLDLDHWTRKPVHGYCGTEAMKRRGGGDVTSHEFEIDQVISSDTCIMPVLRKKS